MSTFTATLPLVLRGSLDDRSLAGQAVIVTGAGGGIGLEAARSLLHLGASVVVAEVNTDLCATAEALLSRDVDPSRVLVRAVDVGQAEALHGLVAEATARFGKIDAVLNNATYAPAGAAVVETPIEMWDHSYAVNLRGPALLARECLPGMIERGHGVFACVSSTGGPYLAPYETLKAAQLALANSLDAELARTGVVAFTIGPGLVPTPTAVAAIERIAPRLGMTVETFWATNRGAVVSVEAAGAGFAAAIAMAGRYAGQEISSTQALIDAGIAIREDRVERPSHLEPIVDAQAPVLKTLKEQAEGWKQRSFFERQWMLRDFKQRVGMSVERVLEMLSGSAADCDVAAVRRLAAFYGHLGDLAAGYVKDPEQRRQQLALTAAWRAEVEALVVALG